MTQEPDSEDLLSSLHHEDVEAALVRVVSELVHPGIGRAGPGTGSGLVISAGREDAYRQSWLRTFLEGNYFT